MNLNLEVPLNSLSFGFCSYNILLELYKKGISPCLFPIGNQVDLSCFDKAEEDFKFYINSCVNKAQKYFSKDNKGLKLWHIQGSESSVSRQNSLFTFYELDSPTDNEINILNNQKSVFVSSNETKDTLQTFGTQNNVVYCPLGFDTVNFKKLNKSYPKEKIVFSIFGKFEKRKGHMKTIPAWIKKFGNNPRYALHLHCYNPHFTPEQNSQVLLSALNGNKPFNVTPFPYLQTLSELNDSFNATNIVIDMSGAEGFSLPSFHCLGLGKHGVIHNCSAMKDWANEENSVLVNPTGKEEAYDMAFFRKGNPYNQGNIYSFDSDEFIAGCEKAIARYEKNPINEAGLEIPKKFTWKNTIDTILENI